MVKPAKGTTTLAFIFKEGVIVAADSRASMGGYICMYFSTGLDSNCKFCTYTIFNRCVNQYSFNECHCKLYSIGVMHV